MNPPSALHSAMNKERKPFTYTPGGLNLSEIKSERMAQRLMRNAMNQGVPEKPVQTIQSPPVLASNAMPNFNCLPVQVFPTFSLPANPKSLLRTRSNPNTPKPVPTIAVPKFCTDSTSNVYSYKNINKPSILTPNNNNDNNKQLTLNDCNTAPNNYSFWQPTNYESDNSKILVTQSKIDSDLMQSYPSEIIPNTMKNKINQDLNPASNDENLQMIKKTDILLENSESNVYNSLASYFPQMQEKKDDDYEKKEVKITKKQTKSNNEVGQNGNTEAEIVVKLPSKKSAAKTETTVDVLKKILPDGTVEEVKTTTTKSTVDGKTEITTKTETRTFPKEVDDTEEIEEKEEEFDEIIEKNGQVVEEKEDNENEVKKNVDTSDDVQDEENYKVIGESFEQSNKQNGHIIIEEEKTEENTTKKVVISQSAEQESEEEIEEVEEEEDGETEDVSVEQVIVLKKSSNSQSNESQVDNKSNASSQGELNNEEVKEQEVKDDEEIIEDEEVVEEEENEYEKEKDNNTEKANKSVEKQIEDKDNIVAPKGDGQLILENEIAQYDASKPVRDSGNEDESDAEGEVEGQGEVEGEVEGEVDGEVEDEGEGEVEGEGEGEDEGEGEGEDKGEDEDKSEEEYLEAKDIQEEIHAVQIDNDIEHVDVKNTKKETISPEVQDDNDISIPSQQPQKDVDKLPPNDLVSEPIKDNEKHERKEETIIRTTLQYEPSIPFEKVEDVEIKPIGPAQEIFKKSHTEIITTTTDKPIGALSTQTEFNRVENIVTVNRTSRILDHAYEQIGPSSIPTLNTYFTQNNNRILSSPQPVLRPHQPVYPPEPQTERRHSLLLERLSVERQIPTSDIYQNNYHPTQNQEQPQWLQEPQSEVLTVSNVKPSEITKNQQWYQQTRKEESTYNTVTPTPIISSPPWNKPTPLIQVNQHLQPQPQVQAQPHLQPQYQSFAQPQYAPKPELAPSYTENKSHSKFNNYQQNTYPNYVPKPTWVSSTFDLPKPTVPQSDQFSSLKKESSESYQTSTQQLSSSYVPPPWEQDASYVSNTTNYYQQPPPTTSLTPSTNLAWKPQPSSKFLKQAPMSYVPPAPNQSFVKTVTAEDPSRLPGRKTYYSEYERRYISVPEATYVPGETKLEAQLGPSPQFYCDTNEPTETIEPQWRRELREFTEKTQTSQTETTSVRPPWEEDSKYIAPNDFTAPPPTSWTQTLRPRSWRERSYEPEYANSKEWPRTCTLGRGRPQSSYVKSTVDTLPQRPRGVSVDRYNPNNYLPPTSEHPPVQSQTMNPNIHPKTYHNPTIPAYHARVSAEPREQPAYIQPRSYVDSRAPPVQSRSFKYLQWITGTED